MPPDPALVERLARHGQDHLLRFFEELDEAGQARLQAEIKRIDLDELDDLIRRLVLDARSSERERVDPSAIEAVEVMRLPQTDGERMTRRRAAERGEAALAEGRVAAVLVAGGQGTRLGFEGPKGTYPIGPVSGASLFQLHAEKLRALAKRYGRPIPLYIMTSPTNHEATVRFFEEHDRFGLQELRFFTQGTMPAVDASTGKILLEARDRIALSPDGHGGTVRALAAPGPNGAPSCLQETADRGIDTIFYFQVDNPLVKICDPAFLGLHLEAEARLSFKVVEKVDPEERVGVVVAVNGRAQVIEYSDLDPELAARRDPEGGLLLWAGSIAIHVFERRFLEQLASGGGQLPFHRALKAVPFVDERGRPVKPSEPNAVKFETFIFDALPLAERWTIVETERSSEFEPLKNATGRDSPATVRQRMSDMHADWLEQAGAKVLRRPDGSVPFGVEISPLLALDAADLKGRIPPGTVVDRPTCLGPPS